VTLPGNTGQYHLLLLTAWRYAAGHRWQTALSFLSIMLGVMMVVAVDLASSSAQRAMELSVAAVNGNISHQIVGGSNGVPDSVFTALRTELGVRRSAPTLTARIRVGNTELTLIGADFSSEASLQRRRPGLAATTLELNGIALTALASTDAVVMSGEVAADLGLKVGDSFMLSSDSTVATAMLAATFVSTDPTATQGLVMADIASAQNLTQRTGSIDSIDLVIDTNTAARLRLWLPAGLTLIETSTRNASLEQMTSAFYINLQSMTLLALLVAGLLIYNSVSLAVLQRQKTLGILRSLGVSRYELMVLILLETAVVGTLATVTGILVGLVLAQGLLQLVTRTIDDLYFNLSVTSFLLDWFALAKSLLCGIGISLLAAAIPVWQAGQCQPVTLQQRAVQDQAVYKSLPLLALVGVALMALGYLLLIPAQGSLVLAFVALTLQIFGYCLLVPLAIHHSIKLLLYCAGKSLKQTTRLALNNIQTGMRRTGLAVAALTVVVSVTVGVGIMIGSFRSTVILWLDQSFSGDVQVLQRDEQGAVPLELQTYVATLANVQAVTYSYNQRVESNFGEVNVKAYSGAVAENVFIKSATIDAIAEVESGEGIFVAEPFAYLHNLKVDDELILYTPQGETTLPIKGIFYDYTTGLGVIVMAQALYTRWWPAEGVTSLGLQLMDASNAAPVLRDLRSYVAALPGSWGVVANADIRRTTLTIFDRTFTITKVMRWLAIMVAFVGTLSALLAMQLERMREYALLRATGMTVQEVAAMIGIQTVVLGVLAGLFAMPLGVLISEVLIDVINRRSFGWSMLYSLPMSVLLEALMLATVAALLAGIYPALRVAAVSPAQALRDQ